MEPSTPIKSPTSSPAKFVKPADLFKMRRRTSNNIGTPNGNSNLSSKSSPSKRSSPLKLSAAQRMSQLTPKKSKLSNFSPRPFSLESQSPLKCLNNITDPSPTKKLPTLLRNPFPVKRRLEMFSPKKEGSVSRSPTKRSRLIEINEDANLEPPKMKRASSQVGRANLHSGGFCSSNDWTLKTKLRVEFNPMCKNWDPSPDTMHKRLVFKGFEDSPSKLNDNTISIEAIRNAATVYQHPYLSWLPLYPRAGSETDQQKDNYFKLTRNSQAAKMMLEDWCNSLHDLSNLLISGRCPYFYLCSDMYNILFKQIPSSNKRKPHVQAYITPFSYYFGSGLNKLGVEYNIVDLKSIQLNHLTRESSQGSFGSSRTPLNFDDETTQASTQNNHDSGNISDLDDDDFGEDENCETSQVLESIGLSLQDFPVLKTKRKGFVDSDSNTQTKNNAQKPLASIEGSDNIRKLIKFLQTNLNYILSYTGNFACIPPTLLSPCEFRLSTPQYPEVVLSKDMIDVSSRLLNDQQNSASDSSMKQLGPSFIQLKGTILPNLYDSLHRLLSASDNSSHSCLSTPLESSETFKSLYHSPHYI